MRLGWIGAYALAALGGASVASIAIAALVSRGTTSSWVFYVALGLGSMLAGAALARQSPVRSYLEPAIGGLIAVIGLFLVGYLSIGRFGWAGDRQSWLVTTALALGTATTTAIGAWFGGAGRPGWFSTAGTAMFVSMGVVMVGAVGALVAGADVRGGAALAVIVIVLCAVGGFVSQLLVANKARFLCALGVPLVMVVQMLSALIGGKRVVGELVIGAAIMVLPGLIGSAIGWRVKPKRADTPDVLAAFD